MIRKKKGILFFTFFILLIAVGIGYLGMKTIVKENQHGMIYLYGEEHGIKDILDKEFDIWKDYYENQNMRHLFIEYPYYSVQFLNIWMKEKDDKILDQLFEDAIGTAINTVSNKEFFKKIKRECPETIFHGTDVGHQYESTGQRFLTYLNEQGKQDSKQYERTQEVIRQGVKYYYGGKTDDVYRENTMVENFCWEFEQLKNEDIMGIYGAAHIYLDDMDYFTNSVPCMGNQLKEKYGTLVSSKDLSCYNPNYSFIEENLKRKRVDRVTIDGKEYDASYFGENDITGNEYGIVKLRYWRIENAYEDMKDKPSTKDYLPRNQYPTYVKVKDVWFIEGIKEQGDSDKLFYRCDKESSKTYGFQVDSISFS